MASDIIMVKDHWDSERRNPIPPHGLLFPINSKSSFICTDRIAHTTAIVTPVVKHWLEREIAQLFHPMKDRSYDPSHHERTLLPRNYISLRVINDTHYQTFLLCYRQGHINPWSYKKIYTYTTCLRDKCVHVSLQRRVQKGFNHRSRRAPASVCVCWWNPSPCDAPSLC